MDVKSIKCVAIFVHGNSEEPLSGNATVYAYKDEASAPSVTMDSNANKIVILDCGDGVMLNRNNY